MFNLTTFTIVHVVLSLVGIIAGLVVAGGLVAGARLDGWTGVFLITMGAVLTLYLNCFVPVVQLFRRLPALLVAAPTQKEAPFVVTQLLVLVMFVLLGRAAFKRFHPDVAPSLRDLGMPARGYSKS